MALLIQAKNLSVALADRRKKPLIGARATALPENTAKQNMSSALHYGPNDRVKKKKIFIVISFR